MSCVKLSSFCGKSSKRTGRQTRQDRASQHNGHRAEHGLHERCCARVRGVARVVRDMAAVESGVRRSRRCRGPILPRARPERRRARPPRPRQANAPSALRAKERVPSSARSSCDIKHDRSYYLAERAVASSRKKSLRIRLPPHLIPTRDVTRQQAPKHRCVTWAAASAAGTQLKCTRHTQLKAGHTPGLRTVTLFRTAATLARRHLRG